MQIDGILFNRAIWSVSVTALLLCLPMAATTATGADTFSAKCAGCHGADGSGSSPMGQRMKVRDLRSPDVQKQTDAELTSIVTNGKPPMPGYGKSLAPAEIQQVVKYLRSIADKT